MKIFVIVLGLAERDIDPYVIGFVLIFSAEFGWIWVSLEGQIRALDRSDYGMGDFEGPLRTLCLSHFC